MGGYQVPGTGSGDDGYDEDGYDESQRAEILEATRDGPSDGTILTDLAPDVGDEEEDEPIDDLAMADGETGEEAEDEGAADADDSEDEIQDEFDAGTLADDELDDGDEVALQP